MAMPERYESEPLLNVGDVAARLGVKSETVRRWLRSGELRGVQMAKRIGWRVRASDLEAFLDRRTNVEE
ncbi:MAG TPA: helix-turn-helix domain-containing protein [Ktedonobacterales bacterium]|nr:helix-turn-helix domain-containing protein [Ktedonobacterales bacterium]